jgi:nitrogen regulatory protein P-II 2
MKIITAVIKPLKLNEVTDALTALGVGGVTVLEVKGFGQQRGRTDLYGSDFHAAQFLTKLRVDVAVKDEMVDEVVEAIISAAHTGRLGDGKVFVTDLMQVVRIRNHETGNDAL